MKQLLTGLCCCLAASMLSGAAAQDLKSNLTAVYINTEGNAPITSTEVYTQSTLTIVNPDKTTETYQGTRVRGRGNTLFTLAKKPYKLKLASKARLLGQDNGNAKKWNLMADHGDKTLLRNALASFIALQTGQPFAPGAKFVDLTLNGSYCGTYRLTDQIDIRKHRVNITEQPEAVTAFTDITGGYLLEIDDSADDLEGSVFSSEKGVKITIKSPDEEVIVPTQKQYIQDYINQFEKALFADNWLDPTNGYKKYLDLESLVQWYITAELSAEPNSFRSIYFYKDKANDKLYFGPVWDFDFAFDNSSRWGSRPKALVAQEGRGAEWCYTWINRLRQDPEFHNAVNNKWTELTKAGLLNNCLTYIDQQAALINESQKLNFALYNIGEKAHDEQFLFSTYAEGIDFLKSTLTNRATFLTEAFATLANGGQIPITGEQQTNIRQIETPTYYVSNNGNRLHFNALTELNGTYSIYNTAGQLLTQGNIKPEINTNLPQGNYILQWTIANEQHSIKIKL